MQMSLSGAHFVYFYGEDSNFNMQENGKGPGQRTQNHVGTSQKHQNIPPGDICFLSFPSTIGNNWSAKNLSILLLTVLACVLKIIFLLYFNF